MEGCSILLKMWFVLWFGFPANAFIAREFINYDENEENVSYETW